MGTIFRKLGLLSALLMALTASGNHLNQSAGRAASGYRLTKSQLMAKIESIEEFGPQLKMSTELFSTSDPESFDFFMFVQSWPITFCIGWEFMDEHKKRECNITNFDKTAFTIHGLWPTKKFQIGPNFCNKTLHFNSTALDPILPDLEERWHDVKAEKDPYAFWRHEWQKHGTCAVQIPEVDTEFKFFSKALELNRKLNIYEMLKDAGITPGYSYQTKTVVIRLAENLGQKWNATVLPAINCIEGQEPTRLPLLYEVVVCLDKKFELIDCSQVSGGIYGSCRHKNHQDISYPATVNEEMSFLVKALITGCCLAIMVFLVGACAVRSLYNRGRIDFGPLVKGSGRTFRTKLVNKEDIDEVVDSR